MLAALLEHIFFCSELFFELSLLLPEKVQEEIGRTIKVGTWATYEDRKNMPFTNAVLHEVQRFITLLPHVPRCTAVDTHFRGYFLPKVGNCSSPFLGCSS